jgi:hypothetical protein
MAKKKRTKPGFLPGMEPPVIEVLEDAADIYYQRMRDRCELSKDEDAAKKSLIEKMHKEGLAKYRTSEGLLVEVTSKSNVKVKPAKDANGEANHD